MHGSSCVAETPLFQYVTEAINISSGIPFTGKKFSNSSEFCHQSDQYKWFSNDFN